MAKRTCSVEDCDREAKGLGLCGKHYQRLYNHGDPHFVSRRDFAVALFEELATLETDECVLWPGARRGGSGYGLVIQDGRQVATHRLALERRLPCPDPRLLACHQPGIGCQRHCMNYRHLRWATQKENVADRLIDGTASSAGLTVADVRAIRATTGRTKSSLARQYGVTHTAIAHILTRKNWPTVE